MAGPEKNPIQEIQNEMEAKQEQERQQLENNFKQLQEDVQKNPEDINKIDQNVIKNLGEYFASNKKEATHMLFDVLESLKDPQNKLDKRDEKSLNTIKDFIIQDKYSDMEKVGEYQLNKDIFNQDFDFSKMKEYGSFFQSGNTNDWFKNIPENYTDGSNPKVSDFCKDKYFSQSQFVKGLFNKNTERRSEITTQLDKADIVSFLEDDIHQKTTQEIIESIKDPRDQIGKKFMESFGSMDGYREYQDMISQNNDLISKREKQINNLKNEAEKKDKIDDFSMDRSKVTDPEIKKFNTESPNSKFNEIVDVIKQNRDNPNSFKLIEYLNTGDLKGFQTEVYGDKLNESKFKNDGKFGQETLRLTKEYLVAPIARLEPRTLDNSKIPSPNEIPSAVDIADTNPVEKEETPLVEENNVENASGGELVLTEHDLENFDSNREEYNAKVEELSKSRKGITIDLGEYKGTISSIDGGLEIDTGEGSSVRASLKEVKKDKIVIYGEGGSDRTIYNHGDYADLNQNSSPENIADTNPVETEETPLVEENNVENASGGELVLTEHDLENFASNREEYNAKVEELSKSRKGITIDLGEYKGKISSIDGGLEIDTGEGSSVRASLKEVKKDKIVIYGEGGSNRTIYNHGDYADLNQNSSPENIAEQKSENGETKNLTESNENLAGKESIGEGISIDQTIAKKIAISNAISNLGVDGGIKYALVEDRMFKRNDGNFRSQVKIQVL